MKKMKQLLMAVLLAITVIGSFPITETFAGCPVTALSTDGSTSGNARCPSVRYRKAQSVYLITAAELSAAGLASGQNLGQIAWNYTTAPGLSGSGSLIVYLQNTSDVTNTKSTSWATAISGMTVAHNATTTLPNTTGFFTIPFTGGSTFNYTGGGIYVAFDWCYSVGTLSTTAVAGCNTTSNNAVTLLGVQSTATGCPALATTSTSLFRPATQLGPAGFPNDAAPTLIHGLGNMAVGYNTNYAIRAVVTNPGNNTLTSVPVTLNITGANSFSDVQTVASLAPCASTVVTFAGFTPTAIGNNTVAVTVPSDDNNANNSTSYTMTTSKDITSFRYVAPITGGVGFNGGTGDFLGKFTAANNFGNSDTINGFEVIFTTNGQPYNVGIWTDVAGSPGTNIYTSPSQTTVADTVFISLPDIEVSGNYWIGIRQTGTTNVGFGYQTENPVRSTEFKYTSPTGNTVWTDFSPGANFRISATVQYKTPQPPNCAVYLSPSNASLACQNGVTLNYGSGGGGPTGYRVYFGTN